MNCINCGAPPKVGVTACHYCDSPLNQVVPEAALEDFHVIMESLRGVLDPHRVSIVTRFDGPFTAGQVREILRVFNADPYRVSAAGHLVSRTTNPARLLACADLFEGPYRTSFVGHLPRIKLGSSLPPSSVKGRAVGGMGEVATLVVFALLVGIAMGFWFR